MTGKLCKVWNIKLKKAVMAHSFKELMFEGSKKLNVENETIKAFLEDGTEIDDERVFQALPATVTIYLLTDGDKKPWDEVGHENIPCLCLCPSTSDPASQNALQTTSDWSSSLILPTSSFSASLKKDVESGNLSWITKSELLGVICEEIENYTLFPTVSQRDAVARQLVKQFPNLKSNIGEGHEGWALKIYDRMRSNLKKTNVFPCKRKSDSEKSLLKHSSKLKRPRSIPRILEKGNKAILVEESKQMMADEMKKIPPTRDIVAIEVGLEVSFRERKRLIESNVPLEDLQKEYPALFTVFGIAYDFNVLHKIDLQRTVLMSLHACSSAVLAYAEKKKKLLTPLNEVDNNANNLLVMTILLIPEILGENPEFLYKKYPVEFEVEQLKETPITPHVCVMGDPFHSSEIYIVAENKILVECCDFLEGIATLIGLYFVANIEYPKQAVATYKFFQSYVLKLPCKNLPGKLITFCKALP